MAQTPDPGLVELLRKLVSIPSVNPELAGDPAIAGEKRLAEFLAGELERRGFRIEWREIIRGRPNLLAWRSPARSTRRLLLEAHLDTQGVHGMTVPPFDAVISGGRLYGRGACDMKGPMAGALHALTPEVLNALAAAGVEVVFVGAIGEERGNVGAEQLASSGLGADEAIVLEPTELNIVHAHKGTYWFEVETRGRAAHGSSPEMGLNAVKGMMEVIARIDAQTEAARAARRHKTLGQPTVNFGVVHGGTSTNVVPDRCVLEVDRRLLPGEDCASIRAEISRALDQMQAAGRIAGWALRSIKEGVPFETDAGSRLIRRLADACATEGVNAAVEGAAWFSDAGPLSRTCREIAVFGPGSIAQAHTADEYIELSSLQRGSDILRVFFEKLAREAAPEMKAGGDAARVE
jgi:acetylornithine deacetylase/succinyl-diaminopimelate desuccinylase family protein